MSQVHPLRGARPWIHVLAAVLPGIYLGLLLGGSLLAVLANFSVPSLDRVEVLQTNGSTFTVLAWVEWGLAPALLIVTAFAWRANWRTWLGVIVLAIVLSQNLWLLPVLKHQITLLVQGQTPPSTYHHLVYGIEQIAKLLLLVTLALADTAALANRACDAQSP